MPLSWIALNSVKGLGPVRIKGLLQKYGTPEEVFKKSVSEIIRDGVIPEICAAQLSNPELFRNAEKQLLFAQKTGVTVITLSSTDYPSYLREIFAPPPVLYIKGNRTVFSGHAVAVVGTRLPTAYGKKAAVSITKELVQHKISIISGLARGIDSIAHETCILNSGSTVAVLGCGIDRIYPPENRGLAEKIIENGALVSEFPLGTQPESFNFPRRNRIISGLSAAVLVIEAGEKSGSLITAHYALQQGRDVFAVPGPITSAQSTGTFNLLREGASPARSGHEIAESLKVVTHPLVNFTSCPAPQLPLSLLCDAEREIFAQISSVPLRIDELAEKCGKSPGELFCNLLNLELKGLVQQISGQQFIRTE
ncbi:MAG: DNA-protecting protein DprA [Fibrobacter sp.]|nr:DNA-protecting protein DprA [Fibrobacter sp.]